jgi:3-phenylpropionate/trans-cinnamate dioxygenase ferredoxin subunit
MPTYRWVQFLPSFELTRFIQEGEVCTMEIEDKKLCIVHRADGYFAIKDRCPHAGGSLGDGWCDEAGMVVCPLHRIKFDPVTGRNTTGEGYYVPTYPIEQREDGLYIGFEINTEPWWKFW